jgi:hypothetical protein
MKNTVFWDKKSQFELHWRHKFSATESSRLMLCKIWGFHGGHYEECRLLGYKNRAHTSQETDYLSSTEASVLMLNNLMFSLRRLWRMPLSGMWCCGSSKNRRFEGTYHRHHQDEKNHRTRNVYNNYQPRHVWKIYYNYTVFLSRMLRLKIIAKVPSSKILLPRIMDVIRFSETSVLTIVTGRDIPEGGILHSLRLENFKSYIALTGWTL